MNDDLGYSHCNEMMWMCFDRLDRLMAVCPCGYWIDIETRVTGCSARFPRYRWIGVSTENLKDITDDIRQAFQELQFQKPTEYEGV